MVTTFNRTILELKHRPINQSEFCQSPFNRTILELKRRYYLHW